MDSQIMSKRNYSYLMLKVSSRIRSREPRKSAEISLLLA
jgi:hypothetical protein